MLTSPHAQNTVSNSMGGRSPWWPMASINNCFSTMSSLVSGSSLVCYFRYWHSSSKHLEILLAAPDPLVQSSGYCTEQKSLPRRKVETINSWSVPWKTGHCCLEWGNYAHLLVLAVCQNPVLLLGVEKQALNVKVQPVLLIGGPFIWADQ